MDMAKPKIRFKGYTDEWEQRKLGEIITEYKETVDSDCTLPILTSSKTEGVILQEEHFGRKQQHDITGYNILPRNYCTYRNRSDGVDFTFNINKCCDKGIISKFYPVFSGKNSDVFFLSLVLNNSDEVVREIAYTCTGTGQKVLSFLDLQKMKVRVPNFDEQKEIAAYFESLDHLITLHQRKCEQAKKLKKYMLQKMFPQNGQKVPEIRFKGFTDDWEQRELEEIVERVTRKNQDLVSELPLTISAQYGLIDQNEFFDKRVASKDVSGYYLIYNGEFAYNKSTSSDAPWGAIKRLDRYEKGVLSTLYIVFKIRDESVTSSDFLVTYYDTNNWHKDVQAIAAEGARNHGLLNIAPVDFFKTELMLPQDIEEQRKIGDYFKSLNALITLHQRKAICTKNVRNNHILSIFLWERAVFMGKMILYHGSPNEMIHPIYGLGEDKHDYGRGFYLTANIELAKEWAVCRPDQSNGWVHKYELETDDLRILDFQQLNVLSWLAELMKHREASDSKRYRMLAAKFIEKYGIDTDGYDVIKGWRADASYFYIAKAFVRDEIDVDILEELLFLGDLGIQYCIKSEKGYANLHELESELLPVSFADFNDKYNERDIAARENMRKLIDSDANKVTKVFSTLI